MIYQTVNFNSFVKSFKEAGRGDQFSSMGFKMLYDYLENLYAGEHLELDVIGLCCQYAEYTKEEFLNGYNIDGIDSIEDLEQDLLDGDIDCVLTYDIDQDIIIVNNDY